jgi:hypothetical protein
MPLQRQRPAGKAGRGSSHLQQLACDYHIQRSDDQAECGKRAAISAYNWRVLSFDSCTRLFQLNPEWRRA